MTETAALKDYLAGRPCPKCSHARRATDTGPEWQCPSCGVAYLKYRAPTGDERTRAEEARRDAQRQRHIERMQSVDIGGPLQPPPPGMEFAARGHGWSSLLLLLAANLASMATALATGAQAHELIFIYWAQSLMLCFGYMLRMLLCRHYTTAGMSDEYDQPKILNPSRKTAESLIAFMVFAFMHTIYLLFILFPGGKLDPAKLRPLPNDSLMLVGLLSFAVQNLYTLWRDVMADRYRRLNLHTVAFLPIGRIVPMHLICIAARLLPYNEAMLVTFSLLKTVADVVCSELEKPGAASSPPEPSTRR